jgi:hypothetical protein
VYLEGTALRLRALLASAAGRGGRCVGLSALSRRVLFPGDPARSWHVLVACAATTVMLHSACAVTGNTAGAALPCGCDTCLSGDTECFVGEVTAATPHCAGVALRLRLSGRYIGREVPVVLTHHLSGTAQRQHHSSLCALALTTCTPLSPTQARCRPGGCLACARARS